MNDADYYTAQFYTWEYRGRGIHLCDSPVHLEPPFIPFFRHRGRPEYVDDGKKHTLLSSFIASVKGVSPSPAIDTGELDYQTIEPFEYAALEGLSALQVRFAKDRKITLERMKALLIMLSSYDLAIVSFEIIGTEETIILQFVSMDSVINVIETYITAYFPDALMRYANDYLSLVPQRGYGAAYDVGLQQEFFRPIQTAKNLSLDPLIGVCAILDRLCNEEQGIVQILFQSTCNTWSESIIQSVSMGDGTSFFINDPTAPQRALEKTKSPLFAVTIRTLGIADDIDTAMGISQQLCRAIVVGSKSDYNQLIPLPTPEYDFETRLEDIQFRQSHRLGMLLNADELVSLLHFPSEAISSRKLFATTRKTVPLPAIAKDKAFVIGENYHNGTTTQATVSIEDRIKHMHIIGATGTGKSTLIANLIAQDIAKHNAVVVFDPHGDLIDDIIARIPAHRLRDVLLIDPSDIEFPIGLNILHAHSDIEREILSSDLVASFRRYATSWGDQMNTVLGNAIQAILEHPKGGTLHDLRRFLIEKVYREKLLHHVVDPTIQYYWHKEFPLLKANSVGPILTRLDSFLRPKSIRNMVIQQKALDFESLFGSHKIVLCKLAQGLIGVENSYVLGSLLLSKIHQALFRRQQKVTRTPVFLYLDEFHNFITPSIGDMLSGIRKYGVGLVLSHQELKQLQRENTELLSSVLSNVNIRVLFRVGEPDARTLQNSMAHFEASDLQNLSRGEAVMIIEQPQYDCSIATIPLSSISAAEKENNIQTVLQHSRAAYATPRAEIERCLFESLGLDTQPKEKPAAPKEERTDSPKPAKPETVQRHHETIPPSAKELSIAEQSEESNISTHRYLQILIKKMAEARGYTATIEAQLPEGDGQVDVLLSKENKTIAVEICNTTNAEWEAHNIEKCIAANYTTIISLSGDIKQLEKIKKACTQIIEKINNAEVKFLTPDALIAYLDESVQQEAPTERVMKGYRVNVSYDTDAGTDPAKKRASIAQIVMNSLKKQNH